MDRPWLLSLPGDGDDGRFLLQSLWIFSNIFEHFDDFFGSNKIWMRFLVSSKDSFILICCFSRESFELGWFGDWSSITMFAYHGSANLMTLSLLQPLLGSWCYWFYVVLLVRLPWITGLLVPLFIPWIVSNRYVFRLQLSFFVPRQYGLAGPRNATPASSLDSFCGASQGN